MRLGSILLQKPYCAQLAGGFLGGNAGVGGFNLNAAEVSHEDHRGITLSQPIECRLSCAGVRFYEEVCIVDRDEAQLVYNLQ